MNFKTLLYIHILKIKTKSSRQNHVIFKFSSHFAMFSCSSPRDDMTLRKKVRLQKCPIFLESRDQCLPGPLLPIPRKGNEYEVESHLGNIQNSTRPGV
jgi:hypothetical protein